jgi:hypothetical protein
MQTSVESNSGYDDNGTANKIIDFSLLENI